MLLPVQIAFLELIIDPACSVVFESEQIDPKIMDQPPRGRGEPMFGRRRADDRRPAGALGASRRSSRVYLWAVLGDRPDDDVRSVTFATLVFGNLALILVNRSWRLSDLGRRSGSAGTAPLKWILVGAGTMLVVLLSVPGLRTPSTSAPCGPRTGSSRVVAGFVGVAWFEVYKVRTRR